MSVEGPGALLRAAREKLHIEVREISDALNLPISAIEAIERNDFDAFQAPVFARGHVRSYARLVELDVDEVLAAFPATVGPTGEISLVGAAVSGSAPAAPEPVGAVPDFLRRLRRLFDELYREQPTVTLVSLGAVAALLLLLLWWLFSGDGDAEVTTDPEPAAEPVAAAPAPAPEVSPFASIARDSGPASTASAMTAPSPEVATAASVEAEGAADVPEVVIDPAPEPAALDDAAAADDDPTSAATAATLVRRINEGADRLFLTFTADCWVDVKNTAGRGLYSNLGKADTSLELIGGGPFRILLGYAPGVTLAFNGDPVALGPHTRNNVARLVVGQ